MHVMAKTTSINLRISPEFRQDIETLAAYHGLSMSSYVHSLLVKSVRLAKDQNADAFGYVQNVYEKNIEPRLAPVVATITPAVDPKDEVRQMLKAGTQRVPVMKQKVK